MKGRVATSFCAASVLAFGVVAFGQSAGEQPTPSTQGSGQSTPAGQGAGQQPAQPTTEQPARAGAGQQITLTGCIQREADYRRAHDAGRGGAAGTGVGAGNEYVLTDVSASPGARAESETAGTTGTTTGAASRATAYELTGPNEGQASQFVGRRVEITGTLKAGEAAAGQPTGGPTAGAPPAGVDVLSKDLRLRELEVSSIKQASGDCPAAR